MSNQSKNYNILLQYWISCHHDHDRFEQKINIFFDLVSVEQWKDLIIVIDYVDISISIFT